MTPRIGHDRCVQFDPSADHDDVDDRRSRYRDLANRGQRVGYALFATSMVLFFVGLATSFNSGLVGVLVALLIAGSVVLAVAIQVGYAIRGAERHEEDARAQRRRR